MAPNPQFIAYLDFLDKLEQAFCHSKRERILQALADLLDQAMQNPAQPLKNLTVNPLQPLADCISAAQMQFVVDAFRQLLENMRPATRSNTSPTRRHHSNRRSSARKPG